MRVPQGKEPPVFLQLFGGGLVVLAGKYVDLLSQGKAYRYDFFVSYFLGELKLITSHVELY